MLNPPSPVFCGQRSKTETLFLTANPNIAQLKTPEHNRVFFGKRTHTEEDFLRGYPDLLDIPTPPRKKQRHYPPFTISAAKIQAVWKGHFERKRYQQLRNACLVLQRGWRAKRYLCSIIKIQSFWKMVLAVRKYQRLRKAVIALQASWRMTMVYSYYQDLLFNSIIIQSWWRGSFQRLFFQKVKHATTFIQSLWKRNLIRREMAQKRQKIIQLQSWWRMIQAKKQYQQYQKSIVLIQSLIRKKHCQSNFLLQKKSAIVIQSVFRSFECRWWFLEQKYAAITIQRLFRIYRSDKQMHQAAVTLQAVYRGHFIHTQYRYIRTMVCRIQKWWRQHWKARQVKPLPPTRLPLAPSPLAFVSPQRFKQVAPNIVARLSMEDKKRLLTEVTRKRAALQKQLRKQAYSSNIQRFSPLSTFSDIELATLTKQNTDKNREKHCTLTIQNIYTEDEIKKRARWSMSGNEENSMSDQEDPNVPKKIQWRPQLKEQFIYDEEEPKFTKPINLSQQPNKSCLKRKQPMESSLFSAYKHVTIPIQRYISKHEPPKFTGREKRYDRRL